MTVPSTPQWGLFVALTVFVLGTLLTLARASERALRADEPPTDHKRGWWDGDRSQSTGSETESPPSKGPQRPTTSDQSPREERNGRPPTLDAVPARQLLANVVLSHGLLAIVVVGGAWVTEIPPASLGLQMDVKQAVLIGGGLGIGLYLANEAGTRLADRFDVGYDEGLREALAPETRGDWLLLLGVVLPIIAGFEELLFRGAVVGVIATAYGIDPWLLAVVSSGLFGYGHGAQGHSGIAVTAGLGFVLATAFVLTGSLLVVIVAHYLVNAFEFIVHER